VSVVTAAAGVLQTTAESMRAGIVAADAAIRTGLVTRTGLREEAAKGNAGYAAWQVANLATGLAESPGESWTRLVLAGLGVHAEQQVKIFDDNGQFVARVDFLLTDARIVIEFDGAVKYEGAEGRDALVREKRREDALRALGYRVVRLTWTDLQHPDRIPAKLGLPLAPSPSRSRSSRLPHRSADER
jgi:very-short-patch-repair endonuclease